MFSFFKRRREQRQRQIQEIATQIRPEVLWLANDLTKGQGIDVTFLTSTHARGYLNGYIESIAARYKSLLGREGVTLLVFQLFKILLTNLKKTDRQDGSEFLLIDQEPAKFYLESCARQMDDSFKTFYKDGQQDTVRNLKKTTLLAEHYLKALQTFLDGTQTANREMMLLGLLKDNLGPGLPISSGNGTRERPFIVTEESDYVAVEYVVAKNLLSMLREDFKMRGTSLLRLNERVIDEHTYDVHSTGNSPDDSTRNFYFDITNGFSKAQDIDPPRPMPRNPTPLM